MCTRVPLSLFSPFIGAFPSCARRYICLRACLALFLSRSSSLHLMYDFGQFFLFFPFFPPLFPFLSPLVELGVPSEFFYGISCRLACKIGVAAIRASISPLPHPVCFFSSIFPLFSPLLRRSGSAKDELPQSFTFVPPAPAPVRRGRNIPFSFPLHSRSFSPSIDEDCREARRITIFFCR